ncbi:ubl carboxyl-terminal hydrolase 18-like [Salarias fasciatus]|uniref:Ubl carboxyl-terminal hydrolase 18-like n=1 Tax=Salarias fasciatus TaxID=181472 RepID=A0A672HG21_SALFA|nr:ubl carboxyl-terminal hydrolase 18-like [Salarias fasciatus]
MSYRMCGWIFGSYSYFGMRGLTNHHLSCCVNTLLQTLSATWEMAELLEKWDTAGRRAASDNVPLQLKRVLAAMRGDSPQPAPHRDFLHCLHANNIRLNKQHDADEVFLFILNSIQKQMDDAVLALEIQDLYRIPVENVLRCLECSSVQTRTSYLLSLPLHIKDDHKSLEDCLKSFFEHQELKGQNCCFCAQCERKTPSKQGLQLLSLPRVLCVHLKRFRNTRGDLHKLNCKLTFPETFDFSEAVSDALAATFTQDERSYVLYAVVVHSGATSCGHYTAYVRHSGDNSWYYADDSHVQKASWEEVQTTYGGKNSNTAYMLMYRRLSEQVEHPEVSG